eukprot:m51a1_g3560 hypothetical protein (456) ;mRNA; f:1047634-1049730
MSASDQLETSHDRTASLSRCDVELSAADSSSSPELAPSDASSSGPPAGGLSSSDGGAPESFRKPLARTPSGYMGGGGPGASHPELAHTHGAVIAGAVSAANPNSRPRSMSEVPDIELSAPCHKLLAFRQRKLCLLGRYSLMQREMRAIEAELKSLERQIKELSRVEDDSAPHAASSASGTKSSSSRRSPTRGSSTSSRRKHKGTLLHVITKERRTVPKVLQYACEFLSQDSAIVTEGLFRVSPNVMAVKKASKHIKHADLPDVMGEPLYRKDPNIVAAVLKKWLSDLDEPIFGAGGYALLSGAYGGVDDDEERVLRLQEVAKTILPLETRPAVCYLFDLLHKVHSHSQLNKMNAMNLGTVFAPILVNAPADSGLSASTVVADAIRLIIERKDDILGHTDIFLSSSPLTIMDPSGSYQSSAPSSRGNIPRAFSFSPHGVRLCHTLASLVGLARAGQ